MPRPIRRAIKNPAPAVAAMFKTIDAHLADAQLDRLNALSARTYRTHLVAWAEACQGRVDRDATRAFLAGIANVRTRCTAGIALRPFLRSLGVTWLADVKPRKTHKQDHVILSADEVNRIIAAIPSEGFKHRRNRTLLITIFTTACRISEVLNLRRDNVVLDRACFRTRCKGGEWHTVHLPAPALAALRQWMGETAHYGMEGVFFWLDTGGRPHPFTNHNGLYRQIDAYVSAAGISRKVSFHTFRRACATHALNQGMPVTAVSQMLHHKNLATTMLYAKQDPAVTSAWMDRCAAAVLAKPSPVPPSPPAATVVDIVPQDRTPSLTGEDVEDWI
jgi:integrase